MLLLLVWQAKNCLPLILKRLSSVVGNIETIPAHKRCIVRLSTAQPCSGKNCFDEMAEERSVSIISKD